MSKLFRKEYFRYSASWYFKQNIRKIKKGHLSFRSFIDEKGLVIFNFSPIHKFKKKFPTEIFIIYDKKTETIKEHVCSFCKSEKNCDHYLTVIKYAYHYLTTKIIESNPVQAYQSKILLYDHYHQYRSRKAKIYISNLHSNEKVIRIFFKDYFFVDINRIIGEVLSNPSKENDLIKDELSFLRIEEIEFFKKVKKLQTKFSSKKKFYSIYRKRIPELIPYIKLLDDKVVDYDRNKIIKYNPNPPKIVFKIIPSKNKYLMQALTESKKNKYFFSYTSYVLSDNVFHPLKLPFSHDIQEQIFNSGYLFEKADLIYISAIVKKQLEETNIFLNIDNRINLPKIYVNYPKINFYVKKMDELEVNI